MPFSCSRFLAPAAGPASFEDEPATAANEPLRRASPAMHRNHPNVRNVTSADASVTAGRLSQLLHTQCAPPSRAAAIATPVNAPAADRWQPQPRTSRHKAPLTGQTIATDDAPTDAPEPDSHFERTCPAHRTGPNPLDERGRQRSIRRTPVGDARTDGPLSLNFSAVSSRQSLVVSRQGRKNKVKGEHLARPDTSCLTTND